MSSDDFDGSPTIKWVNVSAEEARSLAPQSEYFNEAKRKSERTSQAVDAALTGPNFADAAPPGTDWREYLRTMIGKVDGGNFTAPARDSSKVTEAIPAPITLSLRSPAGFPRTPGSAAPGDLVSIRVGNGSMEIEVEQAVREGLIRRAARGGYEPLSADDRQTAREQAERQQQEQRAIEASGLDAKIATGDEPDSSTSALIGAINARVPAPAIDALANDMLTNGSLSVENVVRVGEASGLSAEQAMSYASRAVEGFQRQANAAAMSVGVTAEELGDVHDWAMQAMPFEYNNAQRALAFASDARGMKDIARKYRAAKHERQG